MFIRFLVGVTLVAGVAMAQPADTTESAVLADSTALSSSAAPENTLRRWPIRTIEDWLALQPGVAVRYPGAKSIHYRGARDYSNVFTRFDLRVEDPLTGFKFGTFSPYSYHHLLLQNPSTFSQHPAHGGRIKIESPSYSRAWSGSVEITSDHLTGDFDHNWYDLSLRSPRFMNGTMVLDLVSERRYFGDRQPSPIAEQVTPGGEKALPGNSLDGWSHHASLFWNAGAETTVRFWGDYLRDTYQTYDHLFYYYPEHMPRTVDEFADLGVQLRRRLSTQTRLTLSASVSEHTGTHGDGVVFDDRDAYFRGIENPHYNSPYGMFHVADSLGNDPYYDFFFVQDARQLQFAGDLDIHFSRRHMLAIRSQFRTMQVSLSDQFLNKTATAVSLAATDSWQVGDLFVSGSVRADYGWLDPPILSATGSDPITPGPAPTQTPVYEGPTNTIGALSPSISAKYSLGRFAIESAAGIDYALPPLQIMFSRSETGSGLSTEELYYVRTGVRMAVGSWLKTSLEGFYRRYANQVAGGRGAFVDWPGVDEGYLVGLYSWKQRSKSRYIGATARVVARPHKDLDLHLAYTVSKTESTTRETLFDSWHEVNLPGALENHNIYRDFTDALYDQPHKFAAIVDWHPGEGFGPTLAGIHPLEDMSFVATVYAATGFTFTQAYPLQTDRTRQPDVYQVDLRFEKSFHCANMRIVPFVWVRNLFDRHNVAFVYPLTGEPDDEGFLNTPWGQEQAAADPAWLEAYLLRQSDPTYYAPPRQIYLGLRAEF